VDLRLIVSGKIALDLTQPTPHQEAAEEEIRRKLEELVPGAVLLSCSPNRLWVLTAEGEGLFLRERETLEVIETLSMAGAAPLAGSPPPAPRPAPSGIPPAAAWTADSRFCIFRMADDSQWALEFSTAADTFLSPYTVASLPLLLDRSSSASETIDLIEQRASLLKAARLAEERWDHTEAFRLYRQVRKLRGFERDFEAHAGATRAANWTTAPAGIHSAWERKKYPLRGHSAAIRNLQILGDGKRGLSLSEDGRLRFCDLITGRVLWSLDAEFGWAEDVAASPESSACLLLCSDGVIRSLNLNSQVVTPLVQLRSRRVLGLSFAEDANSFLTFSPEGGIENWEIEPGLARKEVAMIDPRWTAVLFSTNRKNYLALGPGPGGLLGDCSNGETLREFRFRRADGRGLVACLSPSAEKVLLTGERPNELEVWNSQSGELILTLNDHPEPITSVAVDSKGRHAVAGCRNGLLKLWDLTSSDCLRTFDSHAAAVTALKFSPNDEFFLSGDAAGNLKFWALDWAWEFES